jgi:ATP-dependent protease ClpP protease subunit
VEKFDFMADMKTIVDAQNKTATIRMYGSIGYEVSGSDMAHAIASMSDSEDVDVIQLRINSGGGSVIDGMSIVSAIRSSKATVHCYVDGIAASMAAVIAVAGDRLLMMDYAKLMIHDPFYEGKKDLSPKEKKALDSITDMLQTILARKGIDKEEIAKLMKEETWFSAEEALKKKLADEVITSTEKNELSALSADELFARINNNYQPQKKSSMKEIAKLLGLPEDATEQQIVNAIRERQEAHKNLKKTLVDRLVERGKKTGVINEKNEQRMLRLAEADFSLFAEMIDSAEAEEANKPAVKPETGRLSKAIDQLGKGEKGNQGEKSPKTWDWYQRNNPQYLNDLEKTNPDEFKRLLDEYENSL